MAQRQTRARKTSFAQRVRVPLGFGYALLFLYLAKPRPLFLYPGIALAGLGSALRVWASGHLNKGRELAVSGPYSWTRNPLYLGSFMMGLGFAVASASIWLLVLFLVLFPAIYVPVMRREEEELRAAFGPRFATYQSGVPLFLPTRLSPWRPQYRDLAPFGGNFQWSKVISNREYRALVGALAVAALISAKMVLWR
ncbi:MAG TPA: isoprenylcysteine carboxylmethyltransferase family protein [Acidobacteriota bacterium]|nr:isoprenylcysteine carboxylmethyltransferase family protein [Acidobacteriota bacterium]